LTLDGDLSRANAIKAVFALHRRGVPTLKAKRAVEAAIRREKVVLDVPAVENLKRLAAELEDSGFSVSAMTRHSIDLKRLRERLGLTQEQFALRYGLELDAVRNWEYGRREPDTAARSYLTVIEREPERIQEALMVPIT
jgi:DNA-binding transcriptional regulator YiaG